MPAEFGGHLGQYIQTNSQRLRLQGDVCEDGHINFPPRHVCLECNKNTMNENGVPHTLAEYRPGPILETSSKT